MLRCQGLMWHQVPRKLARRSLAGVLMTLGVQPPERAPAKLWRVSATGCSTQRILMLARMPCADREKHQNQEEQSPFHLCSSVLVMCPLRVHVWKPNSHYNTVKRWDFREMVGSALMSGLMLFSRERDCGNKEAFGPLFSCTCSSCPSNFCHGM